MKTKTAAGTGVSATALGFCILIASGLGGCADKGSTATGPAMRDLSRVAAGRDVARVVRFTGSIEMVWPGGQGPGAPEAPGRIAEAYLAAFPGVEAGNPGPGDFTYRVVDADGTLHREIQVKLIWAGLEDQEVYPGEIRFVGVVTADTKPCGAQHDGGGCSDEEEGCTHDDSGGSPGEEGGCAHDDGGGCSGEEGGCSHDDGGGSSDAGGPGMGGPGGKVTGADCRVGQIVVGWALDGGTPAVRGDRISWKWFAPDAPKVTQILAALDAGGTVPWPCSLCEKEILGGNLRLYVD